MMTRGLTSAEDPSIPAGINDPADRAMAANPQGPSRRCPRPALARLVGGSVPDQVMRKASCPVLAVPPRHSDRDLAGYKLRVRWP
jgi:Universal stress protein family